MMRFKRKIFIVVVVVGLIPAGMVGGFYYYSHFFNPATVSAIPVPDPSTQASVMSSEQLKPNTYILLQNSITTLSKSKQFEDFIKTDQLIQTHLIQLPLAQRYQILESFLQAVNQHISLVEGENWELSRHSDLFLDTMSEEYQAKSIANSDDQQHYPYQAFTNKLITLLPSEQKSWFIQALNHDFEVLDIGEGFYNIRLNPNYLVKHFVPVLPQSDQLFIKTLAQQNQEQFYSDAAIAISWQDLGERTIFWENYAKQYPDSYFAKDAQALAAHYLYFFIHGMDNTHPIAYFDEQENKPVIESEAKQAFMFIKNKYPASNVSQKIKQLESSVLVDQKIIEPVEPTERSTLMGQL